MNVVDSSGWLEYFAGGRHARVFEPALEDLESLIVPAVSVYEVFKVLLRKAGEEAAIKGVAAMQRGRIIDLDADGGQDPLVLVDRVCPRFVFLLTSVAIGWWRTAAAQKYGSQLGRTRSRPQVHAARCQ